MSTSKETPLAHRVCVLILDGGGVRGISSLLVLQDLMNRVNGHYLRLADEEDLANCAQLKPQDVFKLVAGTSTGGLIAIMLVKLGMEVDDCIRRYQDLSKEIFKKKNFWGGSTHGIAKHRYSGKRLRQCIDKLIATKMGSQNPPTPLPMLCEAVPDKLACAVVCRERESSSEASDLKNGGVPICNFPCDRPFLHSVCDAATATSAAPTYFPMVKLADRCFIDGGMQYNNPSHFIHDHYGEQVRFSHSRPERPIPTADPRHNNLDLSRVRYVNIGTGTKTTSRKRDRLEDKILPLPLKNLISLAETLKHIAVESEVQAGMMRSLEQASKGDIIFDRFSAGYGVCFFKLDRHKELNQIEALTKLYLEEDSTRDNLQRVAEAIASEYLEARRAEAANVEVPVSTLATSATTRSPTERILPDPHDVASDPSSSSQTKSLVPASLGSSSGQSRKGTPFTEPDEKAH